MTAISFEDSEVLGKFSAQPLMDQSEKLSDEELLAALRKQIKSVNCRINARKYRAEPINQHKEAARVAVAGAIRSGSLIALPCECGEAKSEAHHDDYSRPLDVRWLCKNCHANHHRSEKTHCANGHPWVPENTYTAPSGKRECITCKQLLYDRRPDRVAEMKRLRKENLALTEEAKVAYEHITELKISLAEMVLIYWGDGDGIEPAPSCIQRAQAALAEEVR